MLQHSVTSFSSETLGVLNHALSAVIAEESGESARHLREILNVVPQHMFIMETDATLSFLNRAALEYLGPIQIVSPSERLPLITHPEDLDDVRQAYADAMANGIAVEVEARLRRKDGEYRWFLNQLIPLTDEQGGVVRWCGTRTDIQARKMGEELVQRENVGLREELDKTTRRIETGLHAKSRAPALPRNSPTSLLLSASYGMSKLSMPITAPRVRIPTSPPTSLAVEKFAPSSLWNRDLCPDFARYGPESGLRRTYLSPTGRG